MAFDVLNAINESREEKLEPNFLSDKAIVFKQINFDDNLITISIEENKMASKKGKGFKISRDELNKKIEEYLAKGKLSLNVIMFSSINRI